MSNCKIGEVKILGHTYTIHADDELESRDISGMSLSDGQTILIQTGLSKTQFAETLIHEILESILEVAGFEDIEHTQIQIIALGLHEALDSMGISLPKIMGLIREDKSAETPPVPAAPAGSEKPS